jgi:hypothetical protein
MQKFYAPYFKEYSKEDLEEMKVKGLVAGYYLVIPAEGSKSPSKRFFISRVVDLQALEEIVSKVVPDASGGDYCNYWIDRSLGADTDGNPAWVNTDQSWRFGL